MTAPHSPRDPDPDNPMSVPDWYRTAGTGACFPLVFVSEITFEKLPRELVAVHRACQHDDRYWFLSYVHVRAVRHKPGVYDVRVPDLDKTADRAFECEVCGDSFSMRCALR